MSVSVVACPRNQIAHFMAIANTRRDIEGVLKIAGSICREVGAGFELP
jgi:hypothetical protein